MDLLFINFGLNDHDCNNINKDIRDFGPDYKVNLGDINYTSMYDSERKLVANRIAEDRNNPGQHLNTLTFLVRMAYRTESGLQINNDNKPFNLTAKAIQENMDMTFRTLENDNVDAFKKYSKSLKVNIFTGDENLLPQMAGERVPELV